MNYNLLQECYMQDTSIKWCTFVTLYLPLWPPIHMVGSRLLIFSASSYCNSFSVGSGEMPSRTISGGLMDILWILLSPSVGVVAPDDGGEPVARYITGLLSLFPSDASSAKLIDKDMQLCYLYTNERNGFM